MKKPKRPLLASPRAFRSAVKQVKAAANRMKRCKHPIDVLELIAADCSKSSLRGVVRCLTCGYQCELLPAHFWQPPSPIGFSAKAWRSDGRRAQRKETA